MTEQNNGKSIPKDSPKSQKAMGIFPRLPLKKVLELLNAMYELSGDMRVRRIAAFDRLGRKPDSGSSKTLLSATNVYKVVITQGEFLQLTEDGKRLVELKDEYKKYQAIYEVLFSNSIFTAFVEKFELKPLPSTDVIIDYLQNTHKLSKEDALACWSVFKTNIDDYGLLQEYSGRRVLVSSETALEKLPKPENYLSEPEPEKAPEIPSTIEDLIRPAQPVPDRTKKSKDPAQPQFNFNIQIHLPDNASPEVYEAIFKNIAIHLLNRDED